MDSLTQIVLGGAVGEAVLGKKVGNKAILWGAVGGTIPDLDTIPGQFLDTVSRLEIHRGFSHSIVFAILLAPMLGFLINRIYSKTKEANWWDWTMLFFWAIFTHPLLDIFTTWGTQFFWPLDWRIAIQSIFVIDPLYTLPFLICLVAAMIFKRKSSSRRKWNQMGLLMSSSYLVLTVFLKLWVDFRMEDQLEKQQITYLNYESRPTPFNTILWTFNVEQEDDFLIVYSSLLDERNSIEPLRFPKKHELLNPYRNHPKIERLLALTNGYYIVEKSQGVLLIHDLRFGLINGFDQKAKEFVFTYIVEQNGGELKITQKENDFENMEEVMLSLWERIWGIKFV